MKKRISQWQCPWTGNEVKISDNFQQKYSLFKSTAVIRITVFTESLDQIE